jgi:murein DD-endopeptidase MepM/ murein hydrolase activator NlpD
MVFVGGLAVVTALPANAQFQSSSSVAAITNSHDLGVNGSQTPKFLPGQNLEASSGALAASRDGVSATTLRSSFGGHSSATYVNNPNGTIQWPFSVTVPISDLFGWRIPPCNWCSSDHKGVDFDPGGGYPIQVVADGVVTKVHPFDDNALGDYVIVTHDVNGLKFDSVYGHMMPGTILVAEGQAVKVTQILGQVGNTGASTGNHLHFEIRVDGVQIDPFAWLTEHAN